MPTAPAIQHAPHLHHSRLPLPEHVFHRSLAGEDRTPIRQRDPAIRPRLTKVNLQRFKNADHQRNPHQRILIELPAARLGFPRVKGRGRYAAQQSSRLSLAQAPFFSDFHEGFDRAHAQALAFSRVRQVRCAVKRVSGNDGGIR